MKAQTKEIVKILKESFPPDILSVFNNGFEFLSPDKMFSWNYLGSKLKWYRPSDLKKLAEQLECLSEYDEYMEKLHLYLEGRSVVEFNCVIIDSEWDAEIYEDGFKNLPELLSFWSSNSRKTPIMNN